MRKNRQRVLAVLGIAFSIFCSQAQASENSKAEAGKISERQGQELLVDRILAGLESAINQQDAKKAASFWTADGVFIDENGHETVGAPAIEERFDRVFKSRPKTELQLHPEKLDFPAANLAMLLGSVSRKQDNFDLPVSRFSMSLVKQNDSWLICQASERTATDLKAGDHLKQLECFMGNWQIQNAKTPTKLEFAWAEGRNFIQSKCTLGKEGEAQQIDRQVIGWDPRTNSIVSWHFNSGGGYGYAKWRKEGDSWLLDFAGVASDGSSSRATNKFTCKGADEFSWQSSNQEHDGVSLPDSDLLVAKRIK